MDNLNAYYRRYKEARDQADGKGGNNEGVVSQAQEAVESNRGGGARGGDRDEDEEDDDEDGMEEDEEDVDDENEDEEANEEEPSQEKLVKKRGRPSVKK